MKMNTQVVVGIRSVGDQAMNPRIESMSMRDALKAIAEFTINNSMPQRFQFAIGRTELDVMVGLGLNAVSHKRKEKAKEISDFIDGLFDKTDTPAHLSEPTETSDDIARRIDQTPALKSQGLPMLTRVPGMIDPETTDARDPEAM